MGGTLYLLVFVTVSGDNLIHLDVVVQDAPKTADFGVVMSTMSPVEGSKPDENLVTSFVAMAGGLPDQSADETNTTGNRVSTTGTESTSTVGPEGNTTTVRATVESTPINEFSNLARILSCAFPMEFPFGVDPEDLGCTGTILKRVLKRLTRVYDGRVTHNYVLLMYVANLVYRHASLAATSARVDMDSSTYYGRRQT